MENTNTKSLDTLEARFYKPLDLAFNRATYTRYCKEYSDAMFLRTGVSRIVQAAKSGREWVQLVQALGDIYVSVGNFFEALRSKRRLRLLEEIDSDVREQANTYAYQHNRNPLAQFPELEPFEIYASDGHSHGCSAHEDPILEKKRAINHIFSLNLKTHALSHLVLTQPAKGKKKEHEIKALKSIGGTALRLGAPTGKKVIHVYDPAVIDYLQWYKWKQGNGVYILTLEKSNSKLMTLGTHEWDKTDPRNVGVVSDELVGPSNGHSMRRIRYIDPVMEKMYIYLTTEMTLPPGLIAYIYKLRWDIEKVFDEIKNRFGQKKAWAKSITSKIQQALFMTLTHNLALMLESQLEVDYGIVDQKALNKRDAHRIIDKETASSNNRPYNTLADLIVRTTQRSEQFIRWLRTSLIVNTSWGDALEKIRPLMLGYLK